MSFMPASGQQRIFLNGEKSIFRQTVSTVFFLSFIFMVDSAIADFMENSWDPLQDLFNFDLNTDKWADDEWKSFENMNVNELQRAVNEADEEHMFLMTVTGEGFEPDLMRVSESKERTRHMKYNSVTGGCQNAPCMNDGYCRSLSDDRYTCDCVDGWTGKNCTAVGVRTPDVDLLKVSSGEVSSFLKIELTRPVGQPLIVSFEALASDSLSAAGQSLMFWPNPLVILAEMSLDISSWTPLTCQRTRNLTFASLPTVPTFLRKASSCLSWSALLYLLKLDLLSSHPFTRVTFVST